MKSFILALIVSLVLITSLHYIEKQRVRKELAESILYYHERVEASGHTVAEEWLGDWATKEIKDK